MNLEQSRRAKNAKPQYANEVQVRFLLKPHRPIKNCSTFTQISITIGTLCFCKKKGQNISFNAIFLGKIAVFCTKTRFFFFWLKLGQNEHQNLVLQPF